MSQGRKAKCRTQEQVPAMQALVLEPANGILSGIPQLMYHCFTAVCISALLVSAHSAWICLCTFSTEKRSVSGVWNKKPVKGAHPANCMYFWDWDFLSQYTFLDSLSFICSEANVTCAIHAVYLLQIVTEVSISRLEELLNNIIYMCW